MVAGLAGAALILAMGAPHGLRVFEARLARLLTAPGDVGSAIHSAMEAGLLLLLPFLAIVLVCGSSAVLLQTRFLFHLGALQPDFARLDPRRGLRRIGGRDSLVQAGRALVKLAILGWAGWHALGGLLPEAARTLVETPTAFLDRLLRALLHLVMLVLGAQACFALVDLVFVRLKYVRRMRMSREDQREEAKESEGDPHIKARIRKIRLGRARRRMMAAVPTATVVVTNPTHYAIALRYDRANGGAPRVVAKGVDEVAARIRAVAEEHRVPLVANPPLARALYRVDLDGEVPAEQFQAVAEVIAYVWRLRGQARVN